MNQVNRIWLLGLLPTTLIACSGAPPRSEPQPAPTVTVTAHEPAASAESETEPLPPPGATASEEPAGSGIGVPACDAYLDAYRRCEPRLAPDIASGERRSYRAERGWLEYMATTPEAAVLPEICQELLDDIEKFCGT